MSNISDANSTVSNSQGESSTPATNTVNPSESQEVKESEMKIPYPRFKEVNDEVKEYKNKYEDLSSKFENATREIEKLKSMVNNSEDEFRLKDSYTSVEEHAKDILKLAQKKFVSQEELAEKIQDVINQTQVNEAKKQEVLAQENQRKLSTIKVALGGERFDKFTKFAINEYRNNYSNKTYDELLGDFIAQEGQMRNDNANKISNGTYQTSQSKQISAGEMRKMNLSDIVSYLKTGNK